MYLIAYFHNQLRFMKLLMLVSTNGDHNINPLFNDSILSAVNMLWIFSKLNKFVIQNVSNQMKISWFIFMRLNYIKQYIWAQENGQNLESWIKYSQMIKIKLVNRLSEIQFEVQSEVKLYNKHVYVQMKLDSYDFCLI